MYSNMKIIRSEKHKVFTISLNKMSLSSYDDKRYLSRDGITSFAYGHYRISCVSRGFDKSDDLVSSVSLT